MLKDNLPGDISNLSVVSCQLIFVSCEVISASCELIIVLLGVPSQSKVNGLICFSFRVRHLSLFSSDA